MKRFIPIFAVVVLLTSGCAGGVTQLFADIGGAIQEDVAEAAEWRAKHNVLVAQVQAAYMAQALASQDTDWDKAMTLYEAALKFSIDNQPQILLERLRERFAKQEAAPPLPSDEP